MKQNKLVPKETSEASESPIERGKEILIFISLVFKWIILCETISENNNRLNYSYKIEYKGIHLFIANKNNIVEVISLKWIISRDGAI